MTRLCISVTDMAGRPKEINPQGEVKRVACNVPTNVARDIEREAKRRGVTVAQVMRERLAQVA